MPGSMRSRITRSIASGDCSSNFNAVGPSPATLAWYPSASRLYLIPIARCPSSSTTRMCFETSAMDWDLSGLAGDDRPPRCSARLGRVPRQFNLEHRTRLRAATAHQDFTPHAHDQSPHDEQPQAGPSLGAFQLVAQPHEAAENLASQLGGNAGPVVADARDHHPSAVRPRLDADFGLHARV